MKKSEAIADEVSKLKNEMEPLVRELDTQVDEFSREMVETVRDWMRKELQRQIEDNADTVNAAGIETLRTAKADFEKLLKQVPNHCKKAIGGRTEWPHHTIKDASQGFHSTIDESFFASAFRNAIGPLGTFLDAHGLLARKQGRYDAWKRVTGGEYEYSFNPGFEGKNFRSIKAYQEISVKFLALRKQFEEKEKELAIAKAKESWEEA